MIEELCTPDEIKAVVLKNDGRVYLVSRIATPAFIAAIEWYWYTPHTPRNRFFDVYGAFWEDMQYIITAFPAGRLDAARRLAKQLGLKIANGVPTLLGDTSSFMKAHVTTRPTDEKLKTNFSEVPVKFFPGGILSNGKDNLSIFTVEYDKDSPVYKNSKRDEEAMSQASSEINDILNRGVKLTPFEIADYIYGSGTFPKDAGQTIPL